jgi:phosphonate transport system substrate-binding protein
MCAREELPASLKAAFTGAMMLVSRDQDLLKKLGNGGYLPADDSDYDIIRFLQKVKDEKKS